MLFQLNTTKQLFGTDGQSTWSIINRHIASGSSYFEHVLLEKKKEMKKIWIGPQQSQYLQTPFSWRLYCINNKHNLRNLSQILEQSTAQGLPSFKLRHFSPPCCFSNTFSLRGPFYTVDHGIRLNVLNSDLLPQTPVSNGSDHTLLLGHFLLFQGLHHPLQSVCGFPWGLISTLVVWTKQQNKTFSCVSYLRALGERMLQEAVIIPEKLNPS